MKEMTENKERSKETKESKESRDRKKAVVVAYNNAVATKTDIDRFVEFFNGEMCRTQAVIPAIDTLAAEDRRQIEGLLQRYPMAKLEKMATKAAMSTFLNGGGQRGFKADIEWLTREKNFLKVINGKYDDVPAHRKGLCKSLSEERRTRQEEQMRMVREVDRKESEQRMRQREEWARGAVTYEEYQRMLAAGEILIDN